MKIQETKEMLACLLKTYKEIIILMIDAKQAWSLVFLRTYNNINKHRVIGKTNNNTISLLISIRKLIEHKNKVSIRE